MAIIRLIPVLLLSSYHVNAEVSLSEFFPFGYKAVGRHDTAEILLKKSLSTINQSINLNKNTHIKLPMFFEEKSKVQSNNLNV
jgi:hypothetical protein